MKQFDVKTKLDIISLAKESLNEAVEYYLLLRVKSLNHKRRKCDLRDDARKKIRIWTKQYNSDMNNLISKTGTKSGDGQGRPKKPVPADEIWDKLEEKEKFEIFKDWLKQEREKGKKTQNQHRFSELIKQARRIEIWGLTKEGIRQFYLRDEVIKDERDIRKRIIAIAEANTIIDSKGVKIYLLGREPLTQIFNKLHNTTYSDRYIGKLMSELDVCASIRRAKRKKEEKNLEQQVDNIANRDYNSSNIYSADVKYIEHKSEHGNHVYIEPIINWGSSLVVAWDIDYAQGIDQTMRNLKNSNLPNGSIFHTDRGSQYCSNEVMAELTKNNVTRSVSRRGNCLDNRNSEHFNGVAGTMLLRHLDTNKMSLDEIKARVGKFIKWYNFERRQKRLGWLTPYEHFVQVNQTSLNGQLFCS